MTCSLMMKHFDEQCWYWCLVSRPTVTGSACWDSPTVTSSRPPTTGQWSCGTETLRNRWNRALNTKNEWVKWLNKWTVISVSVALPPDGHVCVSGSRGGFRGEPRKPHWAGLWGQTRKSLLPLLEGIKTKKSFIIALHNKNCREYAMD